ncbi:MAG TPA: class I SAM-dependent methyltransferase [Chloroflexota bacterium]|nr:class I SAM-dependent methyltransferase [Chloroflexota bacterium]
MSESEASERRDLAATFEDRDVAASYRLRPPYPPETFEILAGLITGGRRHVLDLGCGTGFVARPLAPLTDQVDAVDVSAAMIAEGKNLPGGDDPRLNWIVGRAEDVELHPPYDLVTAGDSLHWMDWEVVLPRLAGILSPDGMLAILSVVGYVAFEDPAMRDGLLALLRRYSTYKEYRPDFDLVAELERRELFREHGRTETAPVSFRQPADDYVASFHARASLTRERMDPPDAAAFDDALRQLVLERIGPTVELNVRATIVWGKPLRTKMTPEL